ncbi:MAG: CBS domain-containing protein [Candidatus Saganbacteria bacterium]|nr:CBS domain-containing protein [Candidatus Saganbacteria bacterium]
MVLFSEMYISELIGNPVIDALQEPIGKVEDFIVTFEETFPRIIGILIKLEKNKKTVLLMLGEVNLIGKQFITTKNHQNEVPFGEPRLDEVRLCRDILDKQIVDVNGARVVRVNDIKLAKVSQDVRIIAVDVGFGGILRWLKIENLVNFFFGIFKKTVPQILIGWDHIELLEEGKGRGTMTIPHKRLLELHPADIANIISQVKTDQKTAIFDSLSEKTAAEALHELEPHIQAMLLMTINTKKALGVLDKMPVDEAADVLGDIPEEKREEFLRLMRIRKANEIRKLLKHNEETAGGLMTTEFISFMYTYTVQQTIDRIRESGPDAETIYYLYVTNEKDQLIGVLSLRNLIVSHPDKQISEIMIKDIVAATPNMSQREVADLISKYNLLAIPVVDEEKKMLGIITVDDVVNFILPPLSRRKRSMLG